jgi:hypothetical protein
MSCSSAAPWTSDAMDPFEQFVLGQLQQLLGQEQSAAQQATLDTVLAAVNACLTILREILGDLNDPTIGLDALHSQIAALAANQVTDTSSILTAIGTPQQTGDPVTLPATTPSGGSWVDTSNAGNTIWEYVETPGDITPYQYNKLAGSWVDFLNVDGQGPSIDWLFYANDYEVIFDDAWTVNYPSDDPSTILADDTLLSWLTRVNGGATVSWFGGTGAQVQVNMGGSDDVTIFLTKIIDADFQLLKAGIFPPPPVQTPPIWPGIANVVLGTPVAIATGVTITEQMQGVIITITSVPAKQGQFNFDTAISWRNIGALSFFDDNGEQEYPQTLGFEDCVYCPTTMSVASGVRLRSSAGVAGTITPWTIA